MQEAVSVIILDETRSQVLLVKRRDIPVWVFPGGGIDPRETPEQAALREALEETGFHVEIVRKVAEYETVNRFTQPTHFFEAKIVSGSATLGEESQEVRFFPLQRLPLLPPPYKGWIKDALLNSPTLLRKPVEGVSYWVFIKLLIQHPILVARYLLTRMGIHLNS